MRSRRRALMPTASDGSTAVFMLPPLHDGATVDAVGANRMRRALALPDPNFKDGWTDGRHGDRFYLRVEDARRSDGRGHSVGRSLLRRLVVAHFRQPCGALQLFAALIATLHIPI